jgi:dihydropteroate synthase
MHRHRWRISPTRTLEPFGADAPPLGWPLLMAIVNVTPDSFSDGGAFDGPDAAVRHAMRCISEGASIVDIGGESTRPGAQPVPAHEQVRRTVPVIEALVRMGTPAAISIDTTSAAVASAALAAGAHIVNDVSAGEDDPRMFGVCAKAGCGLVLMHRLRRPSQDSYSHQYAVAPEYRDVVSVVCGALSDRVEAALAAGVARESIAVDPGLGFGKSVDDNWSLIRRLDEMSALGHPVLVGASRKSFVGARAGISDPRQRDAASAEAAVECARRGAAILRVHDVAIHRDALAAWRRTERSPAPCQGP